MSCRAAGDRFLFCPFNLYITKYVRSGIYLQLFPALILPEVAVFLFHTEKDEGECCQKRVI